MDFTHKLAFRKSVPFLFIAFFILLLFPYFFSQPVGPGLDPSCNLSVNLALKYHLTFGKDYVFTFGPLGILNDRFPVAVSRWSYLLADIYFLLTLFLILKDIFKRHFGFFLILFLFAAFAIEIYDSMFHRYFLFFLFYVFSFVKEPRRAVNLIQAALLSILSFYYKANLGMTAVAIFILALSYLVMLKKISLKTYGWTVVAYCSCILVSAAILNINLKGYITGNLHLIDSYNDAMFLPGSPPYLQLLPTAVFIILLMAAFSLFLLGVAIHKEELLKYADEVFIFGAGLLAVFILFKSGFVRFDDIHPFVFFKIVPLVAGLLYLFTPFPARKIVAVGAWAVLIRSFVSLTTLSGGNSPIPAPQELFSRRFHEIRGYFHQLKKYKEEPERSSPANPEIKQIIGDHSADIIPFEISRIWFNGLHYNPRPVIQSYSAYDSYLDDLNYWKYSSDDAPDYVLFSLDSIDNRYAFSDEPKVKLAILGRYTVAGWTKEDLVLRKKKPAPLINAGEETHAGKIGQDIPVNNKYDLQYSKIFVRYTLLSRIRRLFYQPPSLKITLTLENGEEKTFRAIPPMLEDGLILNKFVANSRDFQMLMQTGGHLCSTIKKFRLEEDPADGGGFTGDIKIRTTYYTFPPRPEPERTADSLGMAKLLRQFDQYKPLLRDSSFYVPDTYRCWVESEEDYSPLIQIRGWAYRENDREDKGILVTAVLRSGNTLYELPAEMEDRWDISAYYNRKHVVAGFIARVGKTQLPPGKYEVGIMMADTLRKENRIRYTDQIVINQ